MSDIVKEKRVRIVAWNIYEGGTDRRDTIAEALDGLDADLVGLLEANDPETVAYVAHRLGYEHVIGRSPRSGYHVAMLSRLPIRASENLAERCPTMTRAAIEAIVEAPNGPLRLVTLHLWPGPSPENKQLRMKELNELLPVIAEKNLPTILLGDFNASGVSPRGSIPFACSEKMEVVFGHTPLTRAPRPTPSLTLQPRR